MDPASLAIGVVGLAINVAQVSSSVRQKVSNYKSASGDIQNILGKTDLIGQICSRLEVDLGSPTSRLDAAIIQPALNKCYSSVSNVNDNLEVLLERQDGRKRSMRYVFKKDHIDRSLLDLNESLSMLTACVSVSTHLSLNTAPLALFQHKEFEVADLGAKQASSILTCQKYAPIKRPRKQTLKTNTYSMAYSSSVLVFEASSTRNEDENGEEQRTCRSFLVGSPVIGTFFSLAVKYGRFSPFSLVLDTPRFIYEKDDKTLFDQIISHAPASEANCPFGTDSQSIARWVHKFGIRPNMQLVEAYDGSRYPLLGVLVAWGKYEAAKYLIDRGGPQLGNEQYIFFGLPWNVAMASYNRDLIKLYIELRGPFLTMEEYFELLMPSRGPEVVAEMFDLGLQIFSDDLGNLIWYTMFSLLELFKTLYHRFDAESWALPVRKLLDAGLEIHSNQDIIESTWFMVLFGTKNSTASSVLECCEKWIEVVECTSIPADEFLLVEMMICLENPDEAFDAPEEWMSSSMQHWQNMSVRTKVEMMFDLLNPGYRVPIYSGYQATDDILQIMPALRDSKVFPVVNWGVIEPSHLDWKLSRMADDNRFQVNWPFLKSTTSPHCSLRGFGNLDEFTIKSLASHDRFLELMNTRFERRQRKKWEKLKKKGLVEENWLAMPGSWEMQWWDYQGAW